MKKISLKELRFGSKEMLTKERIKGFFGGMKEEAIDVHDYGRSCRIEIIYLGDGLGCSDVPTRSGTCSQQYEQANQYLCIMSVDSRFSHDGYGY
ncbi:hypothetical protein [Elizabethkingia anophelis]|uniref:hypothetical protein n=1 Tax=Elizabethkingia anophelis TaxID=1117645 RepID=UPI0009990530|nr:hypothetical protein [Elizabethkingia anophelis]OPC49928.1 hypothetical protein BAY05_01535 [Elizabethkingia anophelis]